MNIESNHRTEEDRESDYLRDERSLWFLVQANPKLGLDTDLSELSTSLSNALLRFCAASNAELGSLYLWCTNIGKFILRASHGWASPGWVNAARFHPNQGWIGKAATEDRPLYVPNVTAYENANQFVADAYSRQMFGSDRSSRVTYEAIGLPLKVGPECLGVLALHRRRQNTSSTGQTSGFITTNLDVLQVAANNMAGFVRTLLVHEQSVWDLREERRRADLLASLIAFSTGSDRVEDVICKEVAKAFDAKSVEFYLASDDGNELTRVAGFPESLNRGSSSQRMDKMISESARSKNLQLHRRLADSGCKDPTLIATDGLIERTCIPLLTTDHVLGVIDLRPNVQGPLSLSSFSSSDFTTLKVLATDLASFYACHMLQAQQEAKRAKEDQRRLAVQAMGAMIFQYAHRLGNFVQQIYRLSERIAGADSNEARTKLIEGLQLTIDTTLATLQWPTEIATRISRPAAVSRVLISDLLRQCLENLTIASHSNVSTQLVVPNDVILACDPVLIKEAFRNIIDNAIEAMPDGGSLKIEVSELNEGSASVVFSDSGCGMSPEQTTAALRGFLENRGHRGVGLLISSTIIQTQGGTINIISRKGLGTSVTITLPMNQVGDRDES